MKENIRNKVNTALETLELNKKNGVEMSKEDISSIINTINNLISMKSAGYTDEEKAEIKNRIFDIIPSEIIVQEGVTAINKQYKLNRRKIAGIAAFTTAAAVAIGSLAYVGSHRNDETPVEMTVEAAENVTSMSERMVAFSNTTVSSADNALEAGINLTLNEELTEADKETYANMLTSYRIVVNNDNFTNLEYAEMFGDGTNPTEDLVEAFFEYNTMIKKHLITVSSNNMLNYSYLYENEKDAEVLNESERLIAAINDATDKDAKLQAAKDWYSYTTNILTSTEGNIALSSQALDTLITHSEAYDELTRGNYAKIQGAHIDDELEHYLNTAKDACLGVSNDSNIEVEELTIENLKSVFRLSFINKLNEKYDAALNERQLQVLAGNALNSYNSFDNIVEYVKEHIDLTKYVAIAKDAYIEKQKAEKGLNAPAQKSKNDSGVSDGKGGHIALDQFEQYGIDPTDPNAKEELEAAVQAEEERISEETATTIDTDGSVNNNAAADYAEGYADAQAGNPQKSGRSASYYNGYALGAQDLANTQQQFSGETTTYTPVDGETITNESITEDGYTDSVIAPSAVQSISSTPGTTFVPVDDAEDVSEVIETYDYTSSIKELRSLRDSLVASVYDEYNTGSKTI